MGPTVLISDDDPTLTELLSYAVAARGMSPIADISSQTLELAKRHRPAVIILDLDQLIDGMVVLAQLRAAPETCDAKVIVLTGHHAEGLREQCLELGAHDFYRKPFSPEFIQRVATLAGAK